MDGHSCTFLLPSFSGLVDVSPEVRAREVVSSLFWEGTDDRHSFTEWEGKAFSARDLVSIKNDPSLLMFWNSRWSVWFSCIGQISCRFS